MPTDKYILDGHNPIPCPDLQKWAMWIENNKCTVANTKIDDVTINTGFLGLDYKLSNKSKPLLFETMIFGGVFDGKMERYSTWEEAEIGHNKFVEIVKTKEQL